MKHALVLSGAVRALNTRQDARPAKIYGLREGNDHGCRSAPSLGADASYMDIETVLAGYLSAARLLFTSLTARPVSDGRAGLIDVQSADFGPAEQSRPDTRHIVMAQPQRRRRGLAFHHQQLAETLP